MRDLIGWELEDWLPHVEDSIRNGDFSIMTFNPIDHLMQIKSKQGSSDYLPVQWRLVWFREACPQGTIETEELEYDTEKECSVEAFVWNPDTKRSEKIIKMAKGYARYRAIVTDGKGGRATGTKAECRASFEDYGEKAETGAIGRALAGLGFGTQFAPELDEEHRLVDAPVERTQVTSQPATNGNGQSLTLPELISKAKTRAKTLSLATDKATWEAFLQETIGEPLTDKDLTLALVARVNGKITQIERERGVAAK